MSSRRTARIRRAADPLADWGGHRWGALALVVTLLAMSVVGCGGGGGSSATMALLPPSTGPTGPGGTDPFLGVPFAPIVSPPEKETVIPSSTRVLDEETLAACRAVSDEGRIEWSRVTPQLQLIAPGDTLVFGPCPATPQSALRKVTRIDSDGLVMESIQGKVDEAIQQGSLRAKGRLLPDGTVAPGSFDATRLDLGEFSFSPGDKDKPAGGGGGDSGGSPRKLSGSASISIDIEHFQPSVALWFDFEFDISWFTLERLVFAVNASESVYVEIKLTASVSGTAGYELFKKRFDSISPIVFFIGPVPVWIQPVPQWEATAEISLEATVTVGCIQSASVRLGVQYTDDGGWQSIKEPHWSFTPITPFSDGSDDNVTLTLTLVTGPRMAMLVYSVAGPYVSLEVFFKVPATLHRVANDPNDASKGYHWTVDWQIIVGLEVGAGVTFDIWVVSVDFGFSYTLPNKTPDFLRFGIDPKWIDDDGGILLYDSSSSDNYSQPANPQVSTVEPVSGATGTSVQVTIKGTGFHNDSTVVSHPKLLRNGQTTIAGHLDSVDAEGKVLTATFSLAGAAPGAWNLEVDNVVGSDTLPSGQIPFGVGKTIPIGQPNFQFALISLPTAQRGIPDQANASQINVFTQTQYTSTGPVTLTEGLLDSDRNAYLMMWDPALTADPVFQKYRYYIWHSTPDQSKGFTHLQDGMGYWRVASKIWNGVFVPRVADFKAKLYFGSAPSGYNLIGVPFTEPVPFSSLLIDPTPDTAGGEVSLADAITAGYVDDVAWTYPILPEDQTYAYQRGYSLVSATMPGARRDLQPGRGYWFSVTQDVGVTWPYPGAGSSSARSAAPRLAGWVARLAVEAGGCADPDNYFGVGELPDLPEPPAPPAGVAYLTLRFGAPTRAAGWPRAGGFQPASRAVQAWDFQVVGRGLGGQTVTLTWPDLSLVPAGTRLELADLATGRRTVMAPGGRYEFASTGSADRAFRIVAR